jgi:hypothetical protein
MKRNQLIAVIQFAAIPVCWGEYGLVVIAAVVLIGAAVVVVIDPATPIQT